MYDKELGVVFLSESKNFVDELCGFVTDKRIVPLSQISNITNLESVLRCLQPELIVIDDSFSQITAARIVQKINAINYYIPPLIFVVSSKMNSDYVELCISVGASYYMLKPFFAHIFWERVLMFFDEYLLMEAEQQMTSGMERGLSREEITNRETMKLLYRIGCDPRGKGFLYLHEAVALIANNQTRINMRSRDLYEAIGSKFHQSWSNVQRNIGTAIKSADMDLIKEFLCESDIENIENKSEFSNMEFISLAAYMVCGKMSSSKEDNEYEK